MPSRQFYKTDSMIILADLVLSARRETLKQVRFPRRAHPPNGSVRRSLGVAAQSGHPAGTYPFSVICDLLNIIVRIFFHSLATLSTKRFLAA
jgi:hypothetical protein